MDVKIKLSFIVSFIFALLVWGCEFHDDLRFEDLNATPGYFVECYLTSGDIYKLSATRLSSLNDDYILDYSADFTATIDSVKMYHSLYTENGSNYIYNFGNSERFIPVDTQDTIFLKLISADKDTLTSFTTVPDSIRVNSVNLSNNLLKINIASSDCAMHDYYFLKVKLHRQNEEPFGDVKFYNFSNIESQSKELVFEYSFIDTALVKTISIDLYRVTEANYKYQISLSNAKSANNDNLVFPNPLDGNIENGLGIFTCFSKKKLELNF